MGSTFINTVLQRGAGRQLNLVNRFSGFVVMTLATPR